MSRLWRLFLLAERLTRRMGRRAWDALKAFVFRTGALVAKLPLPGWLRNGAIATWDWLVKVHFAWTGAVARSPPWIWATDTIWKRILMSNVVGIGVICIGLYLISLDSRWVIKTRSDALQVQGQIIAAAIAGDLKVTSRWNIMDPDRPAEEEINRIPFRDDAFASLELSLRPERVAPILKRLIEPTDTRARVYSLQGTMVVDSDKVLRFSGFDEDAQDEPPRRWKDFYTRLRHWLIGKEVQVYRDIGSGDLRNYPQFNNALKGKAETLLFLDEDGLQIVSVLVPIKIKRSDNTIGVLMMSTLPGEVERILGDANANSWKYVLFAFLASIATALVLARTVAEPMKRLSEAAERVSQDINARVDLPDEAEQSSAEVSRMASALRTMVNSLYSRIESSEKFAADVAHELKNPLTAASSTAQCLAYAKDDEQRDKMVGEIEKQLKRLNKLITDVSKASRLDAELARQTRERVPMRDVIESVLATIRDNPLARHCDFHVSIAETDRSGGKDKSGWKDWPDDYVVRGNAGRLAQVLTNLLDNAASFSPEGSQVRIAMERKPGLVEIRVDDQGPGIDEDMLDDIFTRFYTFRPTEFSSRGDNSGLGLSISREIITAHGGRIWAENRFDAAPADGGAVPAKPSGARITIQLPVALEQSDGGSAS